MSIYDTDFVVKLAKELGKICTDWTFEVGVDDSTHAMITAFKNDMIFTVRNNRADNALLVNGIYPPELTAKAQQEMIQTPDLRLEVRLQDAANTAAHIAGTFMPKFQGVYAKLSGRIADDMAGKFTLADRLYRNAPGMLHLNKNGRFPELDGHALDYDAHISVRSGKMVQLNLIVPGDVAVEIVNLLAFLRRGRNVM